MKLMTFHNIIWVVLNVLHTLDVVVVLSDTYAITLFSLNSFFCLLEHLDLVFTWVSSMCKLTRERERGGDDDKTTSALIHVNEAYLF